jgi:predicted amidohydrolase
MEEVGNTSTTAYTALALQVRCRAIHRASDRREACEIMGESIRRIGGQIAASQAFIGADVKLVVLPEYFLTGFPMGQSVSEWSELACLEPDGPEYEELGRVARDRGVYLAGNAYELDPHFPGLYFQSCFVIEPSGSVVLRYRRLNSFYTPTPHDVWDRYLEVYGLEGVFPVARTEVGNLATLASEEILYPELARCLAMRGAEVFLHCTSEAAGDARAPKEAAKVSRAAENMAYVVSANTAGMAGTSIPESSTDGGSKIVDDHGIVLSESGPGESMAAYAEIELDALRRRRRRPGISNLLSRQRFECYAESYRKASFYPANTLLDGASAGREHYLRTQAQTIERLSDLGVI